MSGKDKTLVSILVGTRNRQAPLLKCIRSALRQDWPNLEVLVLDDLSEDFNACKFLSSEVKDRRLKCFRGKRQLGVAGGRNFLMRKARGDVFIVIDDDAIFSGKECISRVVAHLAQNPNIGILAFKIIDHRNDRDRLLIPFSKLHYRRQPQLAEQQQLVSYYLGGGHAIRREVIERCGFYQGNLIFGNEELDLSYRAIQAGIKIVYVPDIVVHHYPEPSVFRGKGITRHSELYFRVRNRIWLAYKYLPFPYLPVYLLLWFGIYGVAALKGRNLKDFLNGISNGIQRFDELERTPLGKRAVRYLRSNFGRLWY